MTDLMFGWGWEDPSMNQLRKEVIEQEMKMVDIMITATNKISRNEVSDQDLASWLDICRKYLIKMEAFMITSGDEFLIESKETMTNTIGSFIQCIRNYIINTKKKEV